MGIKENWEKVDEVCPSCGQVTKRVRGITRQNIKRLFSINFNFTEALITFMLVMILFLAYAYAHETKTSRDWLTSMQGSNEEVCLTNCGMKCHNIYTVLEHKANLSMSEVNFSDFVQDE